MYYDADKNYITKSVTKTVTSNDENINIEIIVDNFSYPINTKYIFLGSTNGRTSDLTFYFNYANIIVKTSQEEIGENPKSNDNNLFIFISGTGGGIGPNPIPDDLTINKLNLKFTETPDGVEHKPRLNFEGETSAIIGSLEIWDNKITLTGGDVDVSNNKIINLKACVLDTDGANKKYVDDTVVSLNADLTQLESDVNTLENDVNNLQTQQTTNTNNILTNTNNITTVTNQTSTNTTAIGVLNNSLAGKLSTVGGSMSGNILMGGNNINGLTAINLQGGGGLYADNANTTFLKPFSTTTLGQIFNFTNHNGTITTMFIRTVERVMELLGPIRMNGNFIYNIADGVGPKDCVNKSQLDTKLSTSGGSMSGNINLATGTGFNSRAIMFQNNNRLITISNNDIVMYRGDSHYIAVGNSGPYVGSRLNMQTNKIIGLGQPTDDFDGATKKYVDDNIPTYNVNSPLAVMYSTVRFELNSNIWQSCKFGIPSNIQSGRFTFNADISIWDSDIALSPVNIKSNKAYINYRICDNAGVPLNTYVGLRIVDLCYNNTGVSFIPNPMNKTNDDIYYSNATTSINYQITASTATVFNDLQFQWTWTQVVIFNDNTISSRSPTDGFSDVRVILSILPTV
jgi:hypothetical protein